ncbi:complement factor H-like [Silurus meridionalis]|uniref:Sushi domain-containing protein n=1 Tax=Silurus meridionalis TaxID=175797 RepID=A0A8T0BFY5_SILME|nr:complement factor H-like [Silurus meridionalis]KAF7705959.1 hypothetical protein HF521_019213 [Silurus meridionalis]
MKMIILALSICTWQVVLVVGQKTCEYPAVPNGHPVGKLKQFYNSGETLSLICDSSHKFDGTRYALCDDGSWILPACKPLDGKCAAPSVLNAKPTGEISAPYPAGSTIRFLCDHGFEFEGTQYALCDDGTWRLPACKRRSPSACSKAHVPNAHLTDGGIFAYISTSFKFECQSGYEFEETTDGECANGLWTLPICKAIRCESPPRIEHGDFTELSGAHELRVQCARLHKLVGPETVTCVNKKWTELPVCKPPCKLEETGEYMMEGEKRTMFCESVGTMGIKTAQCVNGELQMSECRFFVK